MFDFSCRQPFCRKQVIEWYDGRVVSECACLLADYRVGLPVSILPTTCESKQVR